MRLTLLSDQTKPVLWPQCTHITAGVGAEAVIHCWFLRPSGQRGRGQAHCHGAQPLTGRHESIPDWGTQRQPLIAIREREQQVPHGNAGS